MQVQKVFKFGTGDIIPPDSVYLKTIVQKEIQNPTTGELVPCWLVWHYFLVTE
jgi:hypothetical protein